MITNSAIPTGSFAPDSPSSSTPLRPAISRRPSTENITAGSVGASAVPSSSAVLQSKPNNQCAAAASASAVTSVPATPSQTMAPACRREPTPPMCIPPSKRITSSATVTTRCTMVIDSPLRDGIRSEATAAPTRKNAGAGTWSRSLARLDRIAILSNRASERLQVPAPAFFLVGAAVASDLMPSLSGLSITIVQRVVTVALLVILFDGGMHIGRGRLRRQAGAIVWLGVAGTLVTALALAAAAHWLFGFDWRIALLLGTALAPTDPAVVFSVLGRREIAGRSGVLLEGESGANDPVGIALLVSILAAGSGGGLSAFGQASLEFGLQMGVGAVAGLVGGRLLIAFMRRVALPSEGLYALRTLAGAASSGRPPWRTGRASSRCSSPAS